MLQIQFPKSFLWGTATSSYQIEGAASLNGKGPSIWDEFAHKPKKIRNSDTGDKANDHYHRYKEDISLMKKLKIPSYRFSISWPRIFPDGHGKVEEKGLDFYDRLIDELLAKKIRPFVTLYHWDLPLTLQKSGGWYNRSTAEHFANYTNLVVSRFKDRVKDWITINEPWIIMVAGHVLGTHAPGHRNPFRSLRVAHNLLLAHGLALQTIRGWDAKAKVGITNALSPIYAQRLDKPTRALRRAHALNNELWMDPIFKGKYPDELLPFVEKQNKSEWKQGDLDLISKPTDFLGINHYTRLIVRDAPLPLYRFLPVLPKYQGAKFTSMGWEVYPQGFYDILRWVQTEYNNPPVYITENGISLNDSLEQGKVNDPERIEYLKDYLLSLQLAMQKGANVKGYFYWSFMDNFEWQEGYEKRFGLVYVDQADPDLKRIPKESARWYSNLVRENGFSY